jgi:predicted PurR-regulated permease PerM
LTSQRSRRFILLLFLIASGLVAFVLAPFAGAFFSAAVLAGVLQPVQSRLTRKLGDRPRLAAGSLTAALVLVVFVPLGIMSSMVLREATEVADWVADTYRTEGVDGLLAGLPEPLEEIGIWIAGSLAGEAGPENGREPAQLVTAEAHDPAEFPGNATQLGAAASAAGGVVVRLADLFVRVGVLVVATFFLLSEGGRLVDYVIDLVPLPERRTRALFTSFREVSVGVFAR